MRRRTGWRASAVLQCASLAAVLALGTATAAGTPSWVPHLVAMDEALGRADASTAASAVADAYRAAVGSRTWEAMVDVGDAYRRLAETSRERQAATARSRECYLTAFLHARERRSLPGVLRAAQAFGDLGDREITGQILRVARDLSARLPQGEPRAQADAQIERLAHRFLAAVPPAPR